MALIRLDQRFHLAALVVEGSEHADLAEGDDSARVRGVDARADFASTASLHEVLREPLIEEFGGFGNARAMVVTTEVPSPA